MEKITKQDREMRDVEEKLKKMTEKAKQLEDENSTMAMNLRKTKYRSDEMEFEIETKANLIKALQSQLESKVFIIFLEGGRSSLEIQKLFMFWAII